MPEKYGSLELSVPKEKGEAPNGPQAFKDFGDSLMKPPTGSAKQLLIVQSTGSAAYKAMKGDATLAEDGTLTIGSGVVDATRIAAALKGGPAAGTEALRALGATATTACAGNDSRLSDERTPKANSVNSGKIEDGSVARVDLAIASFQTKRVVTPETGAGSKAKVIITWGAEFADANYTVGLAMNDEIGEAEDSFVVQRINEQTKSKIVVIIKNEGSGNRTGILHAMAWHD